MIQYYSEQVRIIKRVNKYASKNYTNMQVNNYPSPKQALAFTCLQHKSFENTMGKGEIAGS